MHTGTRVICLLWTGEPSGSGLAHTVATAGDAARELSLGSPATRTPPLLSLAEACLRFTPLVAVRADEAVFLEVGACLRGGLYTESALLTRLALLARRFGCIKPRLAAAAQPEEALARARFGFRANDEALRLPLEALADYASPFRRDPDTLKAAQGIAATLRKLGLEELRDFVELPGRTLAGRFGATGEALARVVRSCSAIPSSDRPPAPLAWPGFHPVQRVAERADLSFDPCESLDAVFFVLKGLIDRATARLRGRAERASAVGISLGIDSARPSWPCNADGRRKHVREFRVGLPVAQGSASGLLPILRERLAFELERSPLEGAVISVGFTVLESAPGRGIQNHFFNKEEEESEAWDALVGRLRAKLGRVSAFQAVPVDRHLPEKAWEGVMPEMGVAMAVEAELGLTSWLDEADRFVNGWPSEGVERPARILKQPQPLTRMGEVLIHAEQKRVGKGKGRPQGKAARLREGWRVLHWEGPERLSGEWWEDPAFQGFDRDYYRVLSESGEQLWIFSIPETDSGAVSGHDLGADAPGSRFYLHGYFD